MEFVIQKSDLVHELQTVTGVVEKRATIPILANLLLEATGDALQVGASDMEVTIRGTAKATVVKDGSITLPAAKLLEIARSLPDSDVQFKLLDRNQVSISCERTRYKISGQPRGEFPGFPKIDLDKGVQLPGPVVHRMIERVAFAITREDPRYSLNGALVLLETGKLTMVATDGHRLAYASKPLDVKLDSELRIIVPRKALGELSKLTAELGEEDAVLFGHADKQVFFVVKGHRLTSSVLEGSFPRYENVMPDSCDTTVDVRTDDFAQAVRRVSLLASDRYGRVVRLNLVDGKLELSSKTEVGEAHEELSIDYSGEELTIGFNARYLQDYLGVVGTESVHLELNPSGQGAKSDAGDKPGQLRPVSDDDMEYRYVVMPMHL